jgi:glutamine amidotransferase
VRIAVIDYGIGNLHSAHKALLRAGADAHLVDGPDDVARADAVVLPGVGNFGACMRAVRERDLDEAIVSVVRAGRPFLGICVGMQMLFDSSAESPGVDGLGIIPGTVEFLPTTVKRPQMQWNRLEVEGSDPVLGSGGDWFYFVHSLSAVPDDPTSVIATVDYGGPVVAACRVDDVTAMQFHPEKSGEVGLGVLRRWVETTAATGRPGGRS